MPNAIGFDKLYGFENKAIGIIKDLFVVVFVSWVGGVYKMEKVIVSLKKEKMFFREIFEILPKQWMYLLL